MKKRIYTKRIKIEPINDFQIKYLGHLNYTYWKLECDGYQSQRKHTLFNEVKTIDKLSKVDADIYIVDMVTMIEEMKYKYRLPQSYDCKEYFINSVFKMCFDAGFIWGTDAESMAMNIAKINKEIRDYIAPVELLRMNKRLKNVAQYFKWMFDEGVRVFRRGKLVEGFIFDDDGSIKRITEICALSALQHI